MEYVVDKIDKVKKNVNKYGAKGAAKLELHNSGAVQVGSDVRKAALKVKTVANSSKQRRKNPSLNL